MMGDCRSFANFPSTVLTTNLNAHVLSISYRLANNPRSRTPLQPITSSSSINNRLPPIALSWRATGPVQTLPLHFSAIFPTPTASCSPRRGAALSPWVDLASARDLARLERHRSYLRVHSGQCHRVGRTSVHAGGGGPSRAVPAPAREPFTFATPEFLGGGRFDTPALCGRAADGRGDGGRRSYSDSHRTRRDPRGPECGQHD